MSVEKVTVWCALGCNGIIGPYWFDDVDGRPVTVNTERYSELMRRKFIPVLWRNRGVDLDAVVYKQDGADGSRKELAPHKTDMSVRQAH